MKTRIVISKATNPWFNLAYEEQLVSTVEPDEIILYLWQNAHTVVIGKHQNPWREVLVSTLEADGGKLARRLSGGGAVYHDLGNLNFTFVMHKDHENLEKQLSVLLRAVKTLGIDASFSGRNDILAGDRKFSGNAFYNGKTNYYHHGTLLVDVDKEHMGKYLNASVKKLTAKGVTSVKSRVVNLKDLNPEITIEGLMQALEASFGLLYGMPESKVYIDEDSVEGSAKARYEDYASWDWRFGKTPSFDVSFEERFAWGELILNLTAKSGVVTAMQLFSDAMSTELIECFEDVFIGVNFDHGALAGAVEALAIPDAFTEMKRDIMGWIETLPI